MKFRWTWCLPVIASLTLAACGTTSGGGSASKPGPTGPVGDAASLTAYHWSLQQAFTPTGTEDQSWFISSSNAPVSLEFANQRVSVSNLCNVITSGYTTEGQRINTQRAASTLRACNDSQLMLLEQRVGRILPTAKQWNVQLANTGELPRLTLQFIDGTRWQFDGKPTAQTQYGSAPERIFLEVAPQRKTCSHGDTKDYQCLQVREIRYGENGVKTHTGQWENFHSEIEGYKHEAGVSNVLRINRYKRQNVPAEVSSYAYVLDMVVSSAIAEKRK